MNDRNILHEIEGLVTAHSICTPVTGVFDENELLHDVPFDICCFNQPIAVVTAAGIPRGFVSHQTMMLSSLESDEDTTTFRQVCQPLQSYSIISPTETISTILSIAEKSKAEILVVGTKREITGSISREDILEERVMLYLSKLLSALESAAVELCTLYPRSFMKLSEARQKKAIDLLCSKNPNRLKILNEETGASGCQPDVASLLREAIQCTTWCDRKTMLVRSNLGLKDAKQIERTFNYFESVRNYDAHPTAAYTRDCMAATELECADHEMINIDGRMAFLPSMAVSEALTIKSIPELARMVRECKEVIEDIYRVRYRI